MRDIAFYLSFASTALNLCVFVNSISPIITLATDEPAPGFTPLRSASYFCNFTKCLFYLIFTNLRKLIEASRDDAGLGLSVIGARRRVIFLPQFLTRRALLLLAGPFPLHLTLCLIYWA